MGDRGKVAVFVAGLVLLALVVWWAVVAWGDCRAENTFAYCLWSMG